VRQVLTLLRDRQYDPGDKRRASLLTLWDEGLSALFDSASPSIDSSPPDLGSLTVFASPGTAGARCGPRMMQDVSWSWMRWVFRRKGTTARPAVWSRRMNWVGATFAYNWRGGRFAACGLGPHTAGVQVELYGDVGNYAASGLDRAEAHIHGDAQDQVGQILKDGKLVIHGDVGQTCLYGAKGGTIEFIHNKGLAWYTGTDFAQGGVRHHAHREDFTR